MGADVVTATSPPALGAAGAPDVRDSLTRRASLNAVGSLLDYAAKAGVVLAVTPILVSGLGRTVYGMWEMLGRLGSYLTAADGRPTDALRLIIAQHQSVDDDAAKRRYVGASIVVWAITLPFVLLGGAALSWWLAPFLTKSPDELRQVVRITGAFIVTSFVITGLASVSESVLRGMNLGYRRMGLQAALSLLAGALAAGAVWAGVGLAGLGASQIVVAVVTGVCFWALARKYVPWFGVARPTRSEVKALFGVSAWLAVGDAISKILLAGDVVILGAVVAPAAVTTYVLTGYAARTAQGIHIFAAGAAIPGLGGLVGQGERARALRARHELLLFTWLFATVIGATILLWNRAFVSLWVGAENYAGLWVGVLIVLLTAQTLFIRVDAYVLDACLKPRVRVLLSAVAALVTVGLSIWLTTRYGLVGLCLGMLAGRTVQTIGYPILVRAALGHTPENAASLGGVARLVVWSTLLFAGAAALGERVAARSWMGWASAVIASAVLCGALSITLGPGEADRRALWSRLRAIRSGVRRR
jgi:O-antigen/teichoic acid export membrane protein